jgi:hypothetical protein
MGRRQGEGVGGLFVVRGLNLIDSMIDWRRVFQINLAVSYNILLPSLNISIFYFRGAHLIIRLI